MPYLQLDLDAMKRVPDAAHLAGLEEHKLGWGLMRLQAWCWQKKVAKCEQTHLKAFFGTSDVVQALEAFEFIAPLDGRFRVLLVEQQIEAWSNRRRGGLAARGNLRRGLSSNPAESQPEGYPAGIPDGVPEVIPGSPGELPGRSSGADPAVTPSTYHLTTTKEDLSLAATDAIQQQEFELTNRATPTRSDMPHRAQPDDAPDCSPPDDEPHSTESLDAPSLAATAHADEPILAQPSDEPFPAPPYPPDHPGRTSPSGHAGPSPTEPDRRPGPRQALPDGRPIPAPPDSGLQKLTGSMVAAFEEERGVPYLHGGAKDTLALKKCRACATDEAILLLWRGSVRSTDKWLRTNSIAQFGSKFNDIVDKAKQRGLL